MWSTLIVLSALAGVVCGWILPGRRSVAWGGAIPWLGVLAWLLYNEYLVPYQGGGASMWPIAQLVAGSVAAAVGMLAAAVTRVASVKVRAPAQRRHEASGATEESPSPRAEPLSGQRPGTPS